MKTRQAAITFHAHTFVPRLLGHNLVAVDLSEFSRGMAARFGCTCYVLEPATVGARRVSLHPVEDVVSMDVLLVRRELMSQPKYL